MSATPPNFPNMVSAAPAASATPLNKRRGCGSLGSFGGAIVFVLAVMIFLIPWALRMAGRWTPALTWHGVGKLQSSSGASYGLIMEVPLCSRRGRGH